MATINNWNNTVPSASTSFNTGLTIATSGAATNSKQPAFFAYCSTSPANVTGDGTTYTIAMDTAVYNQGSNFNTGTFTFTAPVTGIYQFTLYITFGPGNFTSTTDLAYINANSVQYQCLRGGGGVGGGNYEWPFAYSGSGGGFGSALCGIGNSVLVPLSATQTASFQMQFTGGSKTVAVVGGQTFTYCSGYLVC